MAIKITFTQAPVRPQRPIPPEPGPEATREDLERHMTILHARLSWCVEMGLPAKEIRGKIQRARGELASRGQL